MDVPELEKRVNQAGKLFETFLADRGLNCTLLSLILDHWPPGKTVITDRDRKTLQRRVRDAYLAKYGQLIEGAIEPVVRSLVISTIWWWRKHPDQRKEYGFRE